MRRGKVKLLELKEEELVLKRRGDAHGVELSVTGEIFPIKTHFDKMLFFMIHRKVF